MKSPATLLSSYSLDYSLGLTAKDLPELDEARAVIPAGTRLHLGFQDSEDQAMRVAAARAIRRSGFVPVPIIPARRLRSERTLRQYLTGLRAEEASGSVLIVGGDPAQPQGPYPDAGSVIGSGLLEEHGVREVSVAGHPGGHPSVSDDVMWSALANKTTALARRGLASAVVTQFEFDPDQVLAWLAAARAQGIDVPVRVGVPGPADAGRLLWYASRCGVDVTARVAADYGLSLSDPTFDPTCTIGPDRFIRALAAGYDPRMHGDITLHFFSFTRFAVTAKWISEFRAQEKQPIA